MSKHPPDIKFTTAFTADMMDPDHNKYSGEITLRKLTEKYDTLIIRMEDVIFDMTWLKHITNLTGNRLKDYNSLHRLQGKPCSTVETPRSKLSWVPVYYPAYKMLSTLVNLEYPVIILHENPELVKHHPLFMLFGLRVMDEENLHYALPNANLLSPYEKDNPDYLFPRSFNRDFMDPVYTFRID